MGYAMGTGFLLDSNTENSQAPTDHIIFFDHF